MDQITFHQNYPFVPFLRLAFLRYFGRPVWILMYALWFGFAILSLSSSTEFFSGTTLGFFVAFLLVLPLLVYLNTRNQFRSHHMFSDELQFTITDKHIFVKGTHFESRMDWEVINHVKEYRNWMLIYVSRQAAYHIYKPQVDPMDWQILKSIISGREEINSKLKKDR